jgi:hypothetical protein
MSALDDQEQHQAADQDPAQQPRGRREERVSEGV